MKNYKIKSLLVCTLFMSVLISLVFLATSLLNSQNPVLVNNVEEKEDRSIEEVEVNLKNYTKSEAEKSFSVDVINSDN